MAIAEIISGAKYGLDFLFFFSFFPVIFEQWVVILSTVCCCFVLQQAGNRVVKYITLLQLFLIFGQYNKHSTFDTLQNKC